MKTADIINRTLRWMIVFVMVTAIVFPLATPSLAAGDEGSS